MNQPATNPKPSAFSVVIATSSVLMQWVIIPVGIVLILHNFVFQAFHVEGTSMLPTLHNSDYLVVSKVNKTFAHAANPKEADSYVPQRGEIVIFHFPKDEKQVFVKRVVALPGERVVVKDGTVTVFNAERPNGFNPDLGGYQVAAPITEGSYDDVVPSGNVFVLGDNRTPGGSYDSREWGELPSSYIIGNAVLRLLPLDQVRIL